MSNRGVESTILDSKDVSELWVLTCNHDHMEASGVGFCIGIDIGIGTCIVVGIGMSGLHFDFSFALCLKRPRNP